MTQPRSTNTVWHHATVTRARREQMHGHTGAVVWFTGLSGAGKSTIAHALEEYLHQRGGHTYVLDGDNVRHGLCGDLGFSPADRHENIRRIGELAKLFVDAGTIVLTAFISPIREDRARIRAMLGADFIEVYCKCPLAVCELRDVKGLYKRARAGEIKEFTGIDAPYEEPDNPEIVLDSATSPIEQSVETIAAYLRSRSLGPIYNP